MKFLLIGRGKMGKLIEATAQAAGDEIVAAFGHDDLPQLAKLGRVADVVIDFSRPEALPAVCDYIRRTGTPLVSGTTGYTDAQKAELEKAGLTAVTPPEDIQKTVMSIIYDEIKRGETGSREKFAEIDAFLREAGCDCAILGCTELSVYRVLHSLPPYYIDAMEVLAEEAILRCGKQLRNI